MSAWAEAVWASNKLGVSVTAVSTALQALQSDVTNILDDIEHTTTGMQAVLGNVFTTVNTINSKVTQIGTDTTAVLNGVTNANSTLGNNTYGLSALYNELTDSDYGLAAIAELAVKKNVVLATNTGTAAAPVPSGVSNSDVVNGALFFIKT